MDQAHDPFRGPGRGGTTRGSRRTRIRRRGSPFSPDEPDDDGHDRPRDHHHSPAGRGAGLGFVVLHPLPRRKGRSGSRAARQQALRSRVARRSSRPRGSRPPRSPAPAEPAQGYSSLRAGPQTPRRLRPRHRSPSAVAGGGRPARRRRGRPWPRAKWPSRLGLRLTRGMTGLRLARRRPGRLSSLLAPRRVNPWLRGPGSGLDLVPDYSHTAPLVVRRARPSSRKTCAAKTFRGPGRGPGRGPERTGRDHLHVGRSRPGSLPAPGPPARALIPAGGSIVSSRPRLALQALLPEGAEPRRLPPPERSPRKHFSPRRKRLPAGRNAPARRNTLARRNALARRSDLLGGRTALRRGNYRSERVPAAAAGPAPDGKAAPAPASIGFQVYRNHRARLSPIGGISSRCAGRHCPGGGAWSTTRDPRSSLSPSERPSRRQLPGGRAAALQTMSGPRRRARAPHGAPGAPRPGARTVRPGRSTGRRGGGATRRPRRSRTLAHHRSPRLETAPLSASSATASEPARTAAPPSAALPDQAGHCRRHVHLPLPGAPMGMRRAPGRRRQAGRPEARSSTATWPWSPPTPASGRPLRLDLPHRDRRSSSTSASTSRPHPRRTRRLYWFSAGRQRRRQRITNFTIDRPPIGPVDHQGPVHVPRRTVLIKATDRVKARQRLRRIQARPAWLTLEDPLGRGKAPAACGEEHGRSPIGTGSCGHARGPTRAPARSDTSIMTCRLPSHANHPEARDGSKKWVAISFDSYYLLERLLKGR